MVNVKNTFQRNIILGLVAATVSACGLHSNDSRRLEAADFCQVFEPERWKSVDRGNPVTIQTELANRIVAVIKTEAFRQIVSDVSLKYAGDDAYYQSARKKISAYIGQPWYCDNFRKTFTVSFEKVQSPPPAAHARTVSTDVSIDAQGNVYVDKRKVEKSRLLTLLKTKQEKQSISVIVIADTATAFQHVVDFMSIARRAGITNISFTTKKTK